MLNTVLGYIGSFLIISQFLGGIALWIYIFYYRFKCRNIEACENEHCRNRGSCSKAILTENEKKHLLEMIESLHS